MKGIIFDLDGTLLWTLEDIANAMNKALQEFGLPHRPLSDYGLLVGGGAEDIARRMLPQNRQSESAISLFVETFRKYYRNNWNDKTKLYDGMQEVIDYLTGKNIKMAVLSNKPDEFTQDISAYYLNKEKKIFDPIWGQRKGYPVKPDPTIALTIARQWGLRPQDIGFMGDSNIDMWTAKNAGMIGLGAVWGFRGEEELRNSGADFLLKKPTDLFTIIENR